MGAFMTAAALAAGNFVYQVLQTTPDWGAAFERSFFQAVAIGIYAIFWNSN